MNNLQMNESKKFKMLHCNKKCNYTSLEVFNLNYNENISRNN